MPFGFVSIDSIVQQMRLFAVWCFLSIRACGILLLSCNFSGQRQSVYRYQRRWKFLKLWLLFAIVIIVTATILVLFLSGKFLSVGPWKVEMKRNVTYELATVDVPQYLLIDTNENKQSCAQMFAKIVPNLRRTNATDKELIETLVGLLGPSNLNPAYLNVDVKDENYFLFNGKYCVNGSREKILFFGSQNYPELIEDKKAIAATLKQMISEFRCSDVDFSKCQRIEPSTGRLKLFEFEKELMINRKTWKNDKMFSIFRDILYIFARRTSEYYSPERNKWVKTSFHAVNITLYQNWIQHDAISMNISVVYQKEAFRNFPCFVSLQASIEMRRQPFFENTVVIFDKLKPSTAYNVCAECANVDPICVEVKTKSKSLSSFYDHPKKDTSRRDEYFFAVFLFSIICFFLVKLSLSKCNNIHPTDPIPIENERIETDPPIQEVPLNLESTVDTPPAVRRSSVTSSIVSDQSTVVGQDPREIFTDVSSIHSAIAQ